MARVHRLSRTEARRIALQAQLLGRERPEDLLTMVRQLTHLPVDLTNAVAPAADLVAWSRLGSSYAPADLQAALDERILVELRGTIRPAEDIALFRADMLAWPGSGVLREWQEDCRDWVEANDPCRRDILAALDARGPLVARELPDTCERPWSSTGWTNNKNVTQLLGFMAQRGEVAVAGREGRDRLWDLAERVYPDQPVVPADEARCIRDERRLHAMGIARGRGPDCTGEPLDVGDAGEPAVVDGVDGWWRVDPSLLGRPFHGRTALLSPLDRLVYDRKRLDELFEYDYLLEMYKPRDLRRWGYFALPILYRDRFIGKLDATSDRKAGVFRVNAIHQDQLFGKAAAIAVEREIRALAEWLGLGLELVLAD